MAYVHTYLHEYIGPYVQEYIHTDYRHTCMHIILAVISIQTYMHTHMELCTIVHIYMNSCTYIHVQLYLHTYIHAYLSSYTRRSLYIHACVAYDVRTRILISVYNVQHVYISEGEKTWRYFRLFYCSFMTLSWALTNVAKRATSHDTDRTGGSYL